MTSYSALATWVLYLLGFIIVIIVIFGYLKRLYLWNDCLADIPGPLPFPLVGCMFIFRWSSAPHKILHWLSRIYGNVFCLKLGGTNVVVVNSLETIRRALYKNQDFSDRPQLFSYNLWSSKDSLMMKEYNSQFIKLKYEVKIAMQEVLNNENCTLLRFRKAISALHERFRIGEPFNPEKHIREVMSDLIMDYMFGSCISRVFYLEARGILEKVSNSFSNIAHVGACIDFISVVRRFFQNKAKATRQNIVELHEFVRKVYKCHATSFLEHSEHKTSIAFILRAGNKGYRPQDPKPLDECNIVGLIADLMFNAYEKLSVSFAWCVARLAADKELQREIQKELFEFKDQDYLLKNSTSLLTATINEVLRTSSVLPLGVPRKTLRETTLDGYKIPQGTLVFFNLWSCCNDIKYFPNPQEFNPSRFTSKYCNVEPSQSAGSFPSYCCFSGGDRRCPGDTFARQCLNALTSGFLTEYQLELVTPDKFNGIYGFTQRPCSFEIQTQSVSQVGE